MIRVLLAEDQAMVRGALSALLNLESDIEVLGSAADGEAAWRELQRLKPDVLVTDIEMPGLTGLELAQRIQRHELPMKVIIVTTFARPGFLRRALDAGVSGYLLKDAPAENLAEALRYIIKRRVALTRFATDARLEADNNIAENAIRPIALGRRNWLFAGSNTGGERAAALYSILQTAKLNNLNPEAYLADTLARIAAGHPINRIDELMPWAHQRAEAPAAL